MITNSYSRPIDCILQARICSQNIGSFKNDNGDVYFLDKRASVVFKNVIAIAENPVKTCLEHFVG